MKVAIVGRGTAGAQSVIHFLRHLPDAEIEWHFDPSIPVQTVGEGSVLTLPTALVTNLGFSHLDLDHVDGTFKSGVAKEGWGKTGEFFFHDFPPPNVSYHFNAVKLQDYILSKVKDKVKIVEHNTSSDDVDADYVMDCSGKPSSYEKFHKSKYIPVNSTYVVQCPWDYARFQYTLTIARPYGWVFGIPLQNRCAIGYMYNNTINNLDDVKEDIQNVIKQYNLTPGPNKPLELSFGNYFRQQNFTDRIAYNGNASFFLEPLEATSVGAMDHINRSAWDLWNKNITLEQANQNYINKLVQIENIIMMHYFAGSVYDTPFWEYAQDRGRQCMETALGYQDFQALSIAVPEQIAHIGLCMGSNIPDYGVWWPGSFIQNVRGLGILEQLKEIRRNLVEPT